MGISQEQRNINASKTHTRTSAIKNLKSTDFKSFFGSGFNISITKLDGQHLCPEFVINGEDMLDIAPLLVESLRKSLMLKRHLLVDEIACIDECLNPK